MSDNNEVKHETITEAKHAVMKDIKYLMKDEVSNQGSYSFDYTSAAFAAGMLRPLMIKHGIVKSAPGSVNHGRYGDGVGVDVGYRFRYTLVGAKGRQGAEQLVEGVHYEDVCIEGSGKVGNSGDKSAFAACTTAGKYADLICFYLPMVDDVEAFKELTEIVEGNYETKEVPDEPKQAPKGTKKNKRKSRVKTKKESEPEPEEPEVEDSALRSVDMNVGEAKEVIDTILEQADSEEEALEAIAEFVEEEASLDEDDSRRRVTLMDHVDKVMDALSEVEEEPEPEPEEEDEPEEVETDNIDDAIDEDGYLDPDKVDYEDPDQVAELFTLIDINDDEMIGELMDSFEDGEQLKSFYTAVYEELASESAEQAEAFTEQHFPHFQELIEELMND